MADNPQQPIQSILSDFNTRIRDLEEKNRLVRERVLLLGKNLIATKHEQEKEIKELKKENQELKDDLEKMKRILSNMVEQMEKFVKKEDVVLLERMLKDFQPLEFMRKRDVKDMIEKALAPWKHIKTKKS